MRSSYARFFSVPGKSSPAVRQETIAVPVADALGATFPPYARSYDYPGAFVDDDHRAIAELPVDGALIRAKAEGFLRKPDALALYEHARFADGDVLEMGSAWGLSTTILCLAVRNAKRRARVASIEIDPMFQQATAKSIADQGLQNIYEQIAGDAASCADRLIAQQRRFGFAFIDHDHSYEASRKVCAQLAALLKPGGFALFHDFNDERHRTDPEHYGVHRAVKELADGPEFSLSAIIGCCALVRRRS